MKRINESLTEKYKSDLFKKKVGEPRTKREQLIDYCVKEMNKEVDENPYYIKDGKKIKSEKVNFAWISADFAKRKLNLQSMSSIISIAKDYKHRNGSFSKCLRGQLKRIPIDPNYTKQQSLRRQFQALKKKRTEQSSKQVEEK